MSEHRILPRIQVVPAQLGDLLISNVPCDASVYLGAAVRMDSAGTLFNAIATSLSTSNVIGIVESKSSSVLCAVRVLGVTPAIFSGLDVLQEYFLSDVTAGLITTTPVLAISGHVVLSLGQPFSATRFLTKKGTAIIKA